MFNENNIIEKTPTHFSYLIRPITPCIFGTENYDDTIENNIDDEFFLTAGGIVHSCPNIYELSMENQLKQRKLQSCEHFKYIMKTTTTTTSINKNLNTYDTKFDRYSIHPRFQPISSTLSIDSINSEIELYRERHANGLTQKYNHMTSISSSFLPTTWKSDNYLLFMSFQSSLSNKRTRSTDIPFFVTM